MAMKGSPQSANGVGVQSGLSDQSSFAGQSEKDLGLDNSGKAQVPMDKPCTNVKKNGKTFEIC